MQLWWGRMQSPGEGASSQIPGRWVPGTGAQVGVPLLSAPMPTQTIVDSAPSALGQPGSVSAGVTTPLQGPEDLAGLQWCPAAPTATTVSGPAGQCLCGAAPGWPFSAVLCCGPVELPSHFPSSCPRVAAERGVFSKQGDETVKAEMECAFRHRGKGEGSVSRR